MFSAVIEFPDIAPEIFTIDLGRFSFALRWYALAYIVGILLGWQLAKMALRRDRLWKNRPPMTGEQLSDLMTWIILGIIIGGRLGFVLFYQPAYYLSNPGEIIAIWRGGMSFHGGFLGVGVAGLVFAWRHGLNAASLGDLLALGAPAGLLLGRLANFINAELWGRPSTVPWAVVFPGDAALACSNTAQGLCARHPSQLYEAALEGLALGAVLIWLAFRGGALKRPGTLIGVFLLGYGLARFTVEFFRLADAQYITAQNPHGHVFAGLTMGQVLSLPMVAAGMVILGLALAMGRKT
ncbi:prolipoprotein diacylglyceryl transferase [Aliiroseovarius sp. PTFE2010]|uniref:prolipoprotein diacylglyceryl transferase n=1 Tax=Aliiroseovarius sp. PTFE2010 TaxID=3417190 RepID=UPI003CF382C1